MWCYQKPGFEAVLLAELQRQQQCSQFCDTLLKAEGVSVPAHSCILSAVSPQFSSSLSSSPAPLAGQKRLLEFRALGSCSLLHMVRLLYSGEMVGEGEKEKQEAISAAARLGIHGLVEVTHNDIHHRKVNDGCCYTEVGVQTESQIFENNVVRLGGWRREVEDGTTLLWRETLPTHGTEMWTQTEDLQMSCPSSSQPAVPYETIDINALQSLGQTASLQIPYVPMSVVCANEDNRGSGQSSVSAATPSPAVHYSSVQPNVSSQATPCAVEPQSWGQEIGRAAVMEEWAEEGFEQFEGNIPGFINYFLNPENECSNRRRGRRRQEAGVGGSRTSGTGETRRPRGRRGGLMQTVDVQDVGVSKLSKMFLQRWGMYVNRTGQGGGAVGRRLYIKTREFVRTGRSNQRRKGRGIDWDIDQCANILLRTEAGTSSQRSRRKSTPHQDSPVQRVKRVTRQPPPAQGHEEQPEQIDRLLEEVMMGLDILPNNNEKSQVTSSSSGTGTTATISCVQRSQQRQQTGRQFQGSTSVVTASSGGRDSSATDVLVLQQQHEGEVTDILDQFLQSFERLESAAAQNSTEASQPQTNVDQNRKRNIQVSLHTPHQHHSSCPTVTPAHRPWTTRHSETSESDSPMGPSQASVHSEPSTNRDGPGKSRSPAPRRPYRRRRGDYLFSLEKPRMKAKKTATNEALKKEEVKQRVTRQLQQMPVVQLERRGVLPDNIRVQELSQSPVPKAKRSPSAKVSSCTSPFGTKTYPIRSRFKEAQIMDCIAFLEEPLSNKMRRGRSRKNGLLPSLSPPGISTQPTQSSLSTVEEQMENIYDVEGSDNIEAERRGRKKSLDSAEEMDSDFEVKRICLDPDPAPETKQCNSQITDVEIIDVETVSLNSTGNSVLINNSETIEGEVNLTMEEGSTDADTESNDIIDVDGDCIESSGLSIDKMVHAEVVCSLSANIVTTGAETEDVDDDIDVIGGSSPAPAPVIISWTDASESEDDDVDLDVPEEPPAYTSSVTLSKGELVRC